MYTHVAFNAARGYNIERENYLEHLRKGYIFLSIRSIRLSTVIVLQDVLMSIMHQQEYKYCTLCMVMLYFGSIFTQSSFDGCI